MLELILLCINDLIDDAICNIVIHANDTSFYSKCNQVLICGSNKCWLLNLNLNCNTLKTEVGRSLLILILRRLSLVCLTSVITLAIDMKMDCLLKKTHFWTCWDCLSPLNWIRPLLLSTCSCHVTYAFQSQSPLYSCLNVKDVLAWSRHEIEV